MLLLLRGLLTSFSVEARVTWVLQRNARERRVISLPRQLSQSLVPTTTKDSVSLPSVAPVRPSPPSDKRPVTLEASLLLFFSLLLLLFLLLLLLLLFLLLLLLPPSSSLSFFHLSPPSFLSYFSSSTLLFFYITKIDYFALNYRITIPSQKNL